LLALATFAEGVLIAERICEKPDWKVLVGALKKAAQEFCYDGISERGYFVKNIDCVFLGSDHSLHDLRRQAGVL
jgi:translation initiation factor 2B subunit (eIF-2B alpha/beta/delta family)